jgi:hypothetical protein
VKDYCGFETFHPKCWGKEVIVMDTAVYGRRQVGRCIRASDVEELGERYIGCFTDVISLVDARCSGKHECEIRIPDSVLQQATKCPLQSLAMYMEAGYSCVEGKLSRLHEVDVSIATVYEPISKALMKLHKFLLRLRIGKLHFDHCAE